MQLILIQLNKLTICGIDAVERQTRILDREAIFLVPLFGPFNELVIIHGSISAN